MTAQFKLAMFAFHIVWHLQLKSSPTSPRINRVHVLDTTASFTMLRVSPILATLLLASAATVSAEFKDFFFTSNATKYKCNGTGLVCKPPRICAYEPTIQMYYCCASGAIDAECWKLSPDCDGENESTPSGSQQSCSSGINAFCCLKTR